MPDDRGLPTAEELRKASQHGIATAPRTYASPARDKILQAFPEIERSLGGGESLTRACQRLGLDRSQFFDVMENSPAHAERYSRARKLRAEKWSERIEDAADDLMSDSGKLDANKARVAIDALKWTAAKLHPQTFGDNKQIDVTVTHRPPS